MTTPDLAMEMVTEDEARALRIAVTFALLRGLASDDLLDAGSPSNRSLVSVAQKLGCTIPDWCSPEPGGSGAPPT